MNRKSHVSIARPLSSFPNCLETSGAHLTQFSGSPSCRRCQQREREDRRWDLVTSRSFGVAVESGPSLLGRHSFCRDIAWIPQATTWDCIPSSQFKALLDHMMHSAVGPRAFSLAIPCGFQEDSAQAWGPGIIIWLPRVLIRDVQTMSS